MFIIPYEDRVAGHNRKRARHAHCVVIENSPWKIARLAATLWGVGETERLRGLYDSTTGLCTWWPARLMSHDEGKITLKIADRSLIAEVEINLLSDRRLHLPWCYRFMAENAFAHTPLATSLIDECLAVRERPILLDGRRIYLGQSNKNPS